MYPLKTQYWGIKKFQSHIISTKYSKVMVTHFLRFVIFICMNGKKNDLKKKLGKKHIIIPLNVYYCNL